MNTTKWQYKYVIIYIAIFFNTNLYSLKYDWDQSIDVVGQNKQLLIKKQVIIQEYAKQHGVGETEFRAANPKFHATNYLRENDHVVIPTQFVLPNNYRHGIVVNLPEMRLYYFNKAKKFLLTYPVGIGKNVTPTPTASTGIIRKQMNPTWRPTKTIKSHYKKLGKNLKSVVGPGPDNPLGKYALYMTIPTYLIHGTNSPEGVGVRSTFGCIRLYPEDIKELYEYVKIGDKVNIINKPYKLGLKDKKLYLEKHNILKDYKTPSVISFITKFIETDKLFIDLPAINFINSAPGIVGQRINF